MENQAGMWQIHPLAFFMEVDVLIEFKKNKGIAIAFILPALLLYLVFMISPIFESLFISFFKWTGIGGSSFEFVGLRNYIRVFTHDDFWKSFGRLIYYVVLSLILEMSFGFVLAYLISLKLKGSRIFELVFFLPLRLT